MQSQSKRYVLLAMMLACSLLLRAVEFMLPTAVFIAPGLKLGLANIITVVMLYKFKTSETLTIVVMRVLLGSVLGGGLSGFLYSIVGALLSFIVMFLFKNLKFLPLSVIGVSIIGAVFFNVGQLIVASIMIENATIFVYLAVMGAASIVTGLFVGLVSKKLIENKSIWKNMD